MFPRVNYVRFANDGLHMPAQAHTAEWRVRPRFRQLFPHIHVHEDRISGSFLAQNDLFTSHSFCACVTGTLWTKCKKMAHVQWLSMDGRSIPF